MGKEACSRGDVMPTKKNTQSDEARMKRISELRCPIHGVGISQESEWPFMYGKCCRDDCPEMVAIVNHNGVEKAVWHTAEVIRGAEKWANERRKQYEELIEQEVAEALVSKSTIVTETV